MEIEERLSKIEEIQVSTKQQIDRMSSRLDGIGSNIATIAERLTRKNIVPPIMFIANCVGWAVVFTLLL